MKKRKCTSLLIISALHTHKTTPAKQQQKSTPHTKINPTHKNQPNTQKSNPHTNQLHAQINQLHTQIDQLHTQIDQLHTQINQLCTQKSTPHTCLSPYEF